MAERIIQLPDVGEGIAEAELVEWHVKVGDIVREDDLLAAVMTDKATVEIPSPVEGEVTWVGAEVGDTVAIGSAIVKLKVAGEGAAAEEPATEAPAEKPAPGVKQTLAKPIESYTDPGQLRTLMQNARRLGREDIWRQAFDQLGQFTQAQPIEG